MTMQEQWAKYSVKLTESVSGSCAPNVTEKFIGIILPFLEPQSVVVDVGSGISRYPELFTHAGMRVFRVDRYPPEQQDETHLKGDMHDLPLEDKAANLVFCNHVLEHSMAPFMAMGEANRILKIGGHYAIQIPGCTNRWIHDEQHISVLNFDQMCNLLNKTGFQLVMYSTFFENDKSNPNDEMQCYIAKKLKDI